MHDFAWTTSPDFLERPERSRTRAAAGGDAPAAAAGARGQADRHFDATRAALKYYGKWFGAYPYGQHHDRRSRLAERRRRHGVPDADHRGHALVRAARASREPEGVTVHEAGHQFWYGIVATNEFEHAWMDEGLNTFATARALEQSSDRSTTRSATSAGSSRGSFDDLPLVRATDGNRLAGTAAAATSDDASRRRPGATGRARRRAITYNKTALWLHTLERHARVGHAAADPVHLLRAVRVPASEAATISSPSSNEVSGRDLTWFFDQVHRSSSVVRLRRRRVHQRAGDGRGYVGDGEPAVLARASAPATPIGPPWSSRRFGEGVFPVDVRVVFENGEERPLAAGTGAIAGSCSRSTGRCAPPAQVDPDHVLLLDVNYTNNSRALTPQPQAAARSGRSRGWSGCRIIC